MTVDFKYVRSINNPLFIIMCGYTDFTGQFDPDEFEQVSGPLPTNATVYTPIDEKSDLFGLFLTLPLQYRAMFYGLVVQINHAMSFGDLEAAEFLLEATIVPPELQPLKEFALLYFNNAIIREDALTFSDSVEEVVE